MLRIESISYKVNNRYLLKDVSLSIRNGEMVAILGANGAGKSTLMKILCKENQPSEGRVIYDGKDLNHYSAKELANKRATLYQKNTVSLAFTVREIVLMGRYSKEKMNTKIDNETISKETMEICGISHLADRSMLTLSGGEQQRVHLARVLAQVWDHQDALLLLDEPTSNMDMLYQYQTLAIAKSLAQKGFMVVCVLHEINLAAQYADRVIMLKGGRKWLDGAPEEIFTNRNIFTIFGLQVKVETNPHTLVPQITPDVLKFDAATFNSNLTFSQGKLSLKDQFISYRKKHPNQPLWQIPEKLGVPDAELIFLGLGKTVILLRPEVNTILNQIEKIGVVKSVTYNKHCKTERIGVYKNYSKEKHTSVFVGKDIDLRIFINKWKIIVAVEDKGTESIQFFDGYGNAVHQIYLTKDSSREVYLNLIHEFKQNKQSAPVLEKTIQMYMEEKRDSEIDIETFHKAWNNMQDTHDFFGILGQFGITRIQALRLAPPHKAIQVTFESFQRIILRCLNTKIPIMMFTANKSCVHINTGQLLNIHNSDAWLTISEKSGGKIKLNKDAVYSVWHVVKPTSDGNINSLELYDVNGHLIVQFFGARKPGTRELESWTNALKSL